MAEPAKKLPEDDQPNVRPRFGVIQGGGEGGGPRGNLHSVPDSPSETTDYPDNSAMDPSELSARERANNAWGMSDGTSEASSADGGASGFYNPDGDTEATNGLGGNDAATPAAMSNAEAAGTTIPFKNEDSSGGLKTKLKGQLNRRNGIIGGVLAGIIGGGLFFGGIATGPFQLVNLAHILNHSFSKVQSDSSDRTNHLFRYAKALNERNVGYTRVGILGAKVMGGVIEDLSKVGITIETNKANRPTAINFDRSKLEKQFPETKNMKTTDEYKNFIADKLGVPASELNELKGRPGSLSLDVSKYKFSATKSLIKNGQIGLVGDGKITAGLKARVIGKFFGLGSLFHPFSRALSQKLNDRINAAAEKKQSKSEAEKQFTQEQTDAKTGSVDSKGATAAKAMEDDVKGQKSLRTKAIPIIGVVVAAACIAHQAAQEIPKIDYYRVVAPTEIEAASVISMGSQAMSGSGGITADQVGAKINSFTDKNGDTIWQSAGINALEGNTLATTNNGMYRNDLPSDYKQAYGDHMVSTTIDRVATIILDSMTGPFAALNIVGIHPGATLCNEVVQWGLAAAGTVAQGVADFFSGGTAQVAVTAAETAESLAVQTLVIGNVIKMAENWFINSNTAGKLAEDAFSGPLGGNLLAYGSRAAANVAAIGSGGVNLANNSSTIMSVADLQSEREFRNESLYAKVFDTSDYRSLVNRVAFNLSPGFSSTSNMLSSLSSSILGLGSSLSKVFGSLIPGVRADSSTASWSGNYDWGFPQYGIPQSLLNDPELADPYENANDVGQYLSNACSQSGQIGPDYGSCASGSYGGLQSRMLTCFGNKLSYDSSTTGGTWDVVPASNTEVNPNSDDYRNDNCGDTSDTTWKRIIMWVNDTSTMKAIACFSGEDDQSCSDLGMGGSSTATTTSTTSDISAYKNPLRDVKNPMPNRVDQGVDYGGDSSPIYALGNGTVLHTADAGWPGGWFIVYKLDDGPAAGKYVFVAEECPAVVTIGQHVTSDTVLCNMTPGGYSIEMGWASGPPPDGDGLGYAAAHKEYSEGIATSYGQNFNDLLKKLGAKPGWTSGPGVTSVSNTPLPSGWPTWQ